MDKKFQLRIKLIKSECNNLLNCLIIFLLSLIIAYILNLFLGKFYVSIYCILVLYLANNLKKAFDRLNTFVNEPSFVENLSLEEYEKYVEEITNPPKYSKRIFNEYNPFR